MPHALEPTACSRPGRRRRNLRPTPIRFAQPRDRSLPVSWMVVKGERGFIATIARRLDSLGAITRGQRDSQTAMGGSDAALFRESGNLESVYARAALRQFNHCHWCRDRRRGANLRRSDEGPLRQRQAPLSSGRRDVRRGRSACRPRLATITALRMAKSPRPGGWLLAPEPNGVAMTGGYLTAVPQATVACGTRLAASPATVTMPAGARP